MWIAALPSWRQSFRLLVWKERFLNYKNHRQYPSTKTVRYFINMLHIFLPSIVLYGIAVKSVNASSQEEMERCNTEDVLNWYNYKVTSKTVWDKAAHLPHELFRDIKYLSMKQKMN